MKFPTSEDYPDPLAFKKALEIYSSQQEVIINKMKNILILADWRGRLPEWKECIAVDLVNNATAPLHHSDMDAVINNLAGVLSERGLEPLEVVKVLHNDPNRGRIASFVVRTA